jgi:hypothetical protein
MGTSRTVGVNEDVSTYDLGGGKDYSTANTWVSDEIAIEADLTAATARSIVLEMYGTPGNDAISVTGFTTSASYRPIVRPATGEYGNGIPGNAPGFANTSNRHVIQVSDNYVSIQDIDVNSNINVDVTYSLATFWTGSNDSEFVGVIGYDSTNIFASRDMRGFSVAAGSNIIFALCLVSNLDATIDGAGFFVSGGNAYCYHCVAANSKVGFWANTANILDCINCIGWGNSTDFNGTFDSGSEYNASQDGNAPGSNSLTSISDPFVDEPNDDFHITLNSDVHNVGKDLTGDSVFAVPDDIDFTQWSGPSMGFDEPLPVREESYLIGESATEQLLVKVNGG